MNSILLNCFTIFHSDFYTFNAGIVKNKFVDLRKTMSKYNTFLTFFILTIIALFFFLSFYMNVIFSMVFHAKEYANNDPVRVFSTIFSPAVIISGIILAVSSLTYRIIGIVYVARNKTVSDGEKALWIIGFIIMGFITGIVFLIMAKGRKFVE